MKLTLQLVRVKEAYRLVAIAKTSNELEIDHVKFMDLHDDLFTSAFLMGHPFEIEFEGLQGTVASQEAIDVVKKQKEEGILVDTDQAVPVEVIEAEIVTEA